MSAYITAPTGALPSDAVSGAATATFLGGDGTSVLVDTGHARVLVDCGASPELAALDASSLDAVVLTHAHREHADGLAALADHGFTGPVVATPTTLCMADIGLRDALWTRRETEIPAVAEPVGLTSRVLAMAAPQEFAEPALIAPGVTCRLHRAGHALGSAWVHLDLGSVGTLAVSGDLGRHGHPLLRAADPFTYADTVVVEGTYGDGRRQPDDDHDHLAHVMFTALDRGGTVLVPAGPVDHVATILFELTRLRRVGCLPDGVPVVFDGPTGMEAVDVWRDALLERDPELQDRVLDLGFEALIPGPVSDVRSAQGSARLIRNPGPRVVIAGPHHGDGGRVAAHLRALLPDPRNAVLLQGRSPVGTAARALADGARAVRVGADIVPVRARIAHLPGMTTHADAGEIVEWLGRGNEPETTYIVHGAADARIALRDRVRRTLGWRAELPGHMVTLARSVKSIRSG